MSEQPIFYRYVDQLTDTDGLMVSCDEYVGVKRTRMSWWVVPSWCKDWSADEQKPYRKRIEDYVMPGVRTPPRRYAYPSKEHALRSYRRRKEMQLARAEREARRATLGRDAATEGLKRLLQGEEPFPNSPGEYVFFETDLDPGLPWASP